MDLQAGGGDVFLYENDAGRREVSAWPLPQAQLDAALQAKCNAEFEAGIDKPAVSISADMVLLQNTEQYKDYAVLETVSLGDTIHCINNHLGITTDARVIELEYDSIRQKVTSVVIGDYQYEYFNGVTSATEKAQSAIRNDGTVRADQIQGIINAQKANLRAMKDKLRERLS